MDFSYGALSLRQSVASLFLLLEYLTRSEIGARQKTPSTPNRVIGINPIQLLLGLPQNVKKQKPERTRDGRPVNSKQHGDQKRVAQIYGRFGQHSIKLEYRRRTSNSTQAVPNVISKASSG